METGHIAIIATALGSKLQANFMELFSDGLEESEIIKNKPKTSDVVQEKERFLDQT